MKYKSTLLTGSSGKLGQAIINSGYFSNLLAPTRDILDITKINSIKQFFNKNKFDSVIHCAALARMKECEENPNAAIETNVIGTANLVMETIKKEKTLKRKIRFVHISTDGVYPGIRGNYSEKDETIPYNKYGWTKLGAECTVNLLSNFCIVRTSFFDPKNIKFDESASDMYSSKVPIGYLVKAIAIMLNHDFTGTINIGSERKSDYKRYKQFKHSIKPCSITDILKTISFAMARNASMNCKVWKKIERECMTKKNDKYNQNSIK